MGELSLLLTESSSVFACFNSLSMELDLWSLSPDLNVTLDYEVNQGCDVISHFMLEFIITLDYEINQGCDVISHFML